MEYNLQKPWLSLDEWQKSYIEEKGNCFLLTGRQSGKSAAMSIKIGSCAVKERSPCDYLVIALTEKQAYQLFFKTLMFIEQTSPRMIKRKKDKPTKHEIRLTNGVTIRCYAAGESGAGLRGFTIKKLFIDEAAPMSRETFIAVSPMLSVTGGTIDMASTPRGKEGFFYDCSQREDYRKFYVSAEDCPRHKKEFLEAEKSQMSHLEYAQEYLAMFLDDLKRLFPDELIKKACVLERPFGSVEGIYYLGVDVARMGEDESAFQIIEKLDRNTAEQRESMTTTKQLTTQTADKILDLHNSWKFRNIYIDDGGVGAGVFDMLLREDSTKGKVIAINNASKSLDRNDKSKRKIMKEDLYMNLLSLLEKGRLKLLNDDEVIASLKSVQYEYLVRKDQKTTLRIFGRNTHIAEGLIRAAWGTQSKRLELWCG